MDESRIVYSQILIHWCWRIEKPTDSDDGKNTILYLNIMFFKVLSHFMGPNITL